MSQPERDSNARFTTENSGGPGRPRKTFEQQDATAISQGVSVENWKSVWHCALQEAINGCHKFRLFFANYLCGQPKTIIEKTVNRIPGVVLYSVRHTIE